MNYSLENTSVPSPNFSKGDCSVPITHGVPLIATNAIVSLMGTFGNLLVCVAVATSPRLRRSSNYLLASLAIADLIVTLVSEPLFIGILSRKTFFNDCAAKLDRPYSRLATLSCAASIVHLASISVDRFLAVGFPIHYKMIMEKCGLKIMLIVSWALPISVPIFNVVHPASKAFLATGIFGLSYVIIIVSYLLIMVFLCKIKKKTNQSRARALPEKANSRVEVRVACTLAIVIIVFTAFWFPFIITRFATGKSLLKPNGPAQQWITTLALSNSAMNFLIYTARMRDFRDAYAGMYKKLCHS